MRTNKPEVFEVYRTRQVTLETVVLLADYEALQAERDALAAHLDRIKSILGKGVDVVERSGELAWSVCPDEVSEWENSEPAVSLARLKAQWQAEAMEESARAFKAAPLKGECRRWHHVAAGTLEWEAAKLRRQAEGGEV